MGESIDADVAIVGAGLAGLAAATVAARNGASVVLCDIRTAGGRARSDVRRGYVLNQGPHALYRAGAGVGVLRRLGVEPHGSPPPAAVTGYREATASLRTLPTSALSLLRSSLVGVGDKLRLARLLRGLARLEIAPLASQSAAEWIATQGLTSGGAAVLSGLIRVTTYVGELGLISADAAVGQLQLAAKEGVLYLDGGWQTLVAGLTDAAASAGVQIAEGARVAAVQEDRLGMWEVKTPAADVRAAAVVIAVGSPEAARAILPAAPAWELGTSATVACLDLGLSRPPPTKVAYGLDQPLYFSTHSPNARLAPANGAVVHVMRYGARTTREDRPELWALARRCGVREHDVVVQRFLHEMTACHAVPRPGSGLTGRPAIDSAGADGLFLAGDWIGPIGQLADAALASGEAAGRAAALRAVSVRTPLGAMVGR